MKYNVMFVDESISVLESLQWLFMDEPYYLSTYDNWGVIIKIILYIVFSS